MLDYLAIQLGELDAVAGPRATWSPARRRSPSPGKLKMPDACDHHGPSYMRMVRIFELEGWEGH